MSLYEKIFDRQEKISLVGLGYVGMPIAVSFSRKIDVIEFYNLAMLYRKNINWFLEEESEKEQSTTLKYALELLRKTDEKHQKAVAYAIIGFLKNGDLLEDAAK